MSNTKKIYFLSALVLIIGCYALNLSYSMFVETEESDPLSTTVVTLDYSLNDTNNRYASYSISSNSNKIIYLKINNRGLSNIKYRLKADYNKDIINVKLVDKYDNSTYGNLLSESNKFVWLYVENNSELDSDVTFYLEGNYDTVNFNQQFISNIEENDKYKNITLADNLLINSQHEYNINDTTKSVYSEDNNVDGSNSMYLLKGNDDYGNTYYYRGNVIDNYVEFNNMCYRIVRIDGNNNIKLLLENNDLCNKDSKLNVFANDKLFNDIDYQNEKFNGLDDDAKEYIISDYVWCYGSINKYNNEFKILNENEINSCTSDCKYNYRTNDISLKCDNKNIVVSTYGTLNYDELFLSGLSNSYLVNDVQFDLLDLNYNVDGTSYRYSFDKDIKDKKEDKLYSYRPMIAIKNINNFIGDGTKENPYKLIKEYLTK